MLNGILGVITELTGSDKLLIYLLSASKNLFGKTDTIGDGRL
jgi:hypothetical protein